MNDKDIKDLIKIPEGLDNAVLKGIERGRNEKKLTKKNNILRKSVMVAGVALAITVTAGVISPELVSAIPGINKVFESFNTTLFGEPTEKYAEAATYIGESKVSNGTKITLEEIILDETKVMVSLTVESDFLRGYEDKNEGDFFWIDDRILVNGHPPQSVSARVKIIDDNKGAVIIDANISEFNIGETAKVEIPIRGIGRGEKYLEGKWNFNLEVKKIDGSKRIALDEKLEYNGAKIEVKEIITSKLINTLILQGNYNVDNPQFFNNNFMVKDNNDNYFRTGISKSSKDTQSGDFETEIEIAGDLSNSEYIELMPKDFNSLISENIDGINHELLKCTGSTTSEYEKQLISRPPTEEELKAGYGLDNVYYYLYIDKAREFKTIEELIGTEITVNSTENIIIKDIEITDKSTKVIFESNGMYDCRNFSQLLILDENMNDLSRREGQKSAAIEDEAKGIFSMTLDELDPSKKYKIAIPMMPEFEDKECEWSIRIVLK